MTIAFFRPEIYMDLNQSAFECAVRTLGVPVHCCTIFAAPALMSVAARLSDMKGCKWIEIPSDFLRNEFSWAVMSGDHIYYSAPET